MQRLLPTLPVTLLTFCAICLPSIITAGEINDVALGRSGLFQGRIVGQTGAPRGRLPVSIRGTRGNVITAVTDDGGNFSVRRLPPGVYEVDTGQGRQVYRVWSSTTSPPAARSSASVRTSGNAQTDTQSALDAALLRTAANTGSGQTHDGHPGGNRNGNGRGHSSHGNGHGHGHSHHGNGHGYGHRPPASP